MDDIVDLDLLKDDGLKKIIGKINAIIKLNKTETLFNRTRLNDKKLFIVASSSEMQMSLNDSFFCKNVAIRFAPVSSKEYQSIGVDIIVFDAHGDRVAIQSSGESKVDDCKISYFDVNRIVTQINIKNTKSIDIRIIDVDAFGANASVVEDRVKDYQDDLAQAATEIISFVSLLERESEKHVEKAKKEYKNFAEINSKLEAARKSKGEIDKKIEQQRKTLEGENEIISALEISKSEKTHQLRMLEESISELNLKLAGLSGSEAEIQNRIEDERRKQEALKQDVAVIEANVARLRSQEQLYSEDFSSIRSMFNSHGRMYFLLIILASSGALWVMSRIYDAAMTIATKTDVANPASIFGVLVSRLPIALVNVLVVGALVKLIWVLVVRLLDNNNSLADINQMAYLVRESVEEHKEDFKDESSENRQRMRTQMKTSLIRDFMCGESQRKSEGSNDMTKTGGGIELSRFTDALQEFIKLVKPDAKNE